MTKPIESTERARIEKEFAALINMSADELSAWLKGDKSKSVGWKGPTRALRESVGHASGRRIVRMMSKDRTALTPSDYEHMRKTVGFIRRHLAQEPTNPVTSRWRFSLMNWGHDPLKIASRSAQD